MQEQMESHFQSMEDTCTQKYIIMKQHDHQQIGNYHMSCNQFASDVYEGVVYQNGF